MDCSKTYSNTLAERLKLRRRGLVLCAVIRISGIALVTFAAYAVFDYFFALNPQTRTVSDVILLFAMIGILTGWIIDIYRLKERDMAILFDRITGGRRGDLLGAYELGECAGTQGGGLTEYLTEQAIQRAQKKISKISPWLAFPRNELIHRLKIFTLQLLCVSFAVALNPPAAETIAARIISPARDIPPYSKYVFSVSPAEPRVIYGGGIELSVEISGDIPRNSVRCITIGGGHTTATVCFRDGRAKFVHRLERVTEPLEFYFSAGRARSHRHKLQILYQPEIAAVKVRVTPPAYSGLPVREFLAGAEPLRVLPGGHIRMEVSSNRDLMRGELGITPKDDPGDISVVEGTRGAGGSLTFEWSVSRAADLAIRVFDRTGTPNREALILKQILAVDDPPQAVLSSPPSYSLATPSGVLPLRGNVADDYGLRYVGLTSGLVGYRDRFRKAAGAEGVKEYFYRQDLSLKEIGVKPGDVLEFYLEAADCNPALTGVAVSEISRVEIISEKDYIDILRARTTLEAFGARFKEANQKLEKLRKTVKQLQDTLEQQNPDKEQIKHQLDELKKQYRDTRKALKRLEDDFVIYDIEKDLRKQLRAVNSKLASHEKWIKNAEPDAPGIAADAARMAKDIAAEAAGLKKSAGDAEEIIAIMRLMRQAVIYKQLIDEQQNLVRRLDRYRDEELGTRRAALIVLRRRQAAIRGELEEFIKTTRKLAHALPPQQYMLREDALKFVEIVETMRVSAQMSDAELACRNQNGSGAWRKANEALENMKSLPGDKNGCSAKCKGGNSFAGACAGNTPGNCRGNMQSTLQQMLDALLKKGCQNKGNGSIGAAGGGMSGGQNDGYWKGGQSMLNVPVFGDRRGTYINPRSSMGRGGRGSAAGNGKNGISPQSREQLKIKRLSSADSKSMLIEELPQKYRKSIKEYFSE